MTTKLYTVSDNSGSFTGRGWRLSGPAGFWVFPDKQMEMAELSAEIANAAVDNLRAQNERLMAALRGARSFVQAERDRIYECERLPDGTVPCEAARLDLQIADALLTDIAQSLTLTFISETR
jgi:hypothetical protein